MTDREHGGGTSTSARPPASIPGGTTAIAEFTLKAVLCGLVFGVLFGAANAYIGLTSGLTVSTSIPIAVLSVAIFRLLPGRGTILEANISQTVGSASSSLASGTIFTIPALFMWGIVPSLTQVAILALCGGLLGILAMVPLRRLLIVQADAELPYPEGRACAEVLRATQEERGTSGRWIFVGLGLAAALKVVTSLLHLLPDEVGWSFGQNSSLSLSISAALLAVGFIVGFRAAAVMVVGGFIASLVLYPLVTKGYAAGVADLLAVENVRGALMAYIDRVPEPVLDAGAARTRFVLYVGAGAVAAAGLLTVVRTAPTMLRSFVAVVRGVRGSGIEAGGSERTDRDVPGGLLVLGIAFVVVVLAFTPGVLAGDLPFARRLLAALGAALFAFLFVPVSSRLVGVIGVSSNPTSAMALVTLAGTAAVFAVLGWTELDARAAVLTVGTVVCVAASKAGDISQDLKTGQLVRATPALQQYGQLIAAAVACWAVAAAVLAIGHGQGFTGEGAVAAPQARLMKTIVEAVLGEHLPWDLMAMGGALSLSAALVGLPALSFALGVYLPLGTLATIFVGGLVRRLAERGGSDTVSAGVLCASGFVAGEGLAGVLIVAHAWYTQAGRYASTAPSAWQVALALAGLAVMGAVLYRASRKG